MNRFLAERRVKAISFLLDHIHTVGCDVSTYQDSPDIPGAIDWTKTKSANKFVIIRSSAGIAQDVDFAKNYAGAGSVGLLRAPYHYLYWTNLDYQIETFLGMIRRFPCELPPVIDYEQKAGAPDAGSARAYLKRFLEAVKAETGKVPMIYTSPSYWALFGSGDTYWARYPLWIAHYYVAAPTVPAPWGKWTFWQYTPKGDGKAEGMESYGLDKDYFDGSYDDLLEFAGIAPRPELSDAEKLRRLVEAHPELFK